MVPGTSLIYKRTFDNPLKNVANELQFRHIKGISRDRHPSTCLLSFLSFQIAGLSVQPLRDYSRTTQTDTSKVQTVVYGPLLLYTSQAIRLGYHC